MGGIVIDKLSHSCGTRKGLNVFADPETGKVNSFCFACSTFVANPYGTEKHIDEVELPKPKTPEEIQEEIAEIDGYPTVDIKSRRLRGKYLELFGVKTSLSEEDGKTPTAMYFPMYVEGKLSGYYAKTLGDDPITWAVGNVKRAEPFGWQRAKSSGAYKLIIAEGKEDAVAVEAIFDLEGKEEYKPAVISLPNGVNSVDSSLGPLAETIRRTFKEVLIVFDDDKAGKAATEKAMLLLPEATTAILPDKDPNDCIVKGHVKAAYKAMAFNGHKPKNSRLIKANSEIHKLSRTPTPPGELTWFSPTLQKLMRGVRLGETVYIGAG